MKIRAREGDLLGTIDNALFDVKGLVHPPDRIVAFPRYIPDPNGNRKKDQKRYRKVYALKKRYTLLKQAFPRYLVYDPVFNEQLCMIPVQAVEHHYQPTHCLQDLRSKHALDEVERTALRFMELLRDNAKVPWSKLGISGSIMAGLHTSTSDMDPIIYGTESCCKVYSALKLMLEKRSLVRPYSTRELKELFDFRSKDTSTSFEHFLRTDSRKILQGKFSGRDYFIRFVKDWNEVDEQYGTVHYKPKGYAEIRARVVDDSEAIFTPCHYKIDDVEILKGPQVESIEEIVSFRGRFCEQARSGEVVISQGKVERCQRKGNREHFRLLLGNRVSDHMILA